MRKQKYGEWLWLCLGLFVLCLCFTLSSGILSAATVSELPVVGSLTPTTGLVKGGQNISISGKNFITQKQPFSSISSGSIFSCGIIKGKVYCWGYNDYGELGNNSTKYSLVPVAVDTTGVLKGKTITAISTGYYHSLALASDGTVYSWGENNNGALGNNSTDDSAVPVAVDMTGVLKGKTITAISASAGYSLVLTSDGMVYSWGYNGYGQLGNGSTTESYLPVAVDTTGVLKGKTITAISTSDENSLALASDGTVYSWGNNDYGGLGNNSTNESNVPAAVATAGTPMDGKTIIAISAGGCHSLALASDGTVYSWGENNDGALGNNSTKYSLVPVAVDMTGALKGKTITAISASDNFGSTTKVGHNLALASDGTFYWWGYDDGNNLDRNATGSLVPVAFTTAGTPMAGKNIIEVAVGYIHSLVLASDGTVYSWGYNDYGELGNNSLINSHVPVQVDANFVNLPKVSLCGNSLTNLSIDVSGNDQKLTGLTPPCKIGPANLSITNDVGLTYSSNDLYSYTDSLALTFTTTLPGTSSTSGGDTVTITGTGLDIYDKVTIGNKLATNVAANNDETALVIKTPSNNPGSYDIAIDASDGQKVVKSNAILYMDAGSVAQPVITGISPAEGPEAGSQQVKISGQNLDLASSFNAISGGIMTTCAITKQKVYCWGANYYGELGNNSTTNSSVPVAVTTAGTPMAGKTITAISTGYYHSLALASDGTVYSWGYNSDGELGNNSTTNSSVPVVVTTAGTPMAGKTITAISAGMYYNLALASDGTVYGWGYDGQGQLGNNPTDPNADSLVPVAVDMTGALKGKTITAISAGDADNWGASYGHSLALASDGTVYWWGYDDGNNQGYSTTGSLVPVAVDMTGALKGKTITAISAGEEYSLALASDGTVYSWGWNIYGELGDNSMTSSSVPVAVTTAGTPMAGKIITSISAGICYSLALASDGTVYTWGINSNGHKPGNSQNDDISAIPVAVNIAGTPMAGKTITAISAGDAVSSVLASDGTIYSWGYNGDGELGNNSTTSSAVPVAVNINNVVNDIINQFITISLGGSAMSNVYYDDGEIFATTPSHSVGVVGLSFVNSLDNKSVVKDGCYEYKYPLMITGITPNGGDDVGGDVLTITGHDFSADDNVSFGNIGVQILSVSDDGTVMTVISPTVSGGKLLDVWISGNYLPFGGLYQSATMESGYRSYKRTPQISSISPNSGPAAGRQSITINGKNLLYQNQFDKLASSSNSNNDMCGISYGRAYCWGYNDYNGQIGQGYYTNPGSSPLPSPVYIGYKTKIKTITELGVAMLALSTDGDLYGWGELNVISSNYESTNNPIKLNINGINNKKIKLLNGSMVVTTDNQLYALPRGDNLATNINSSILGSNSIKFLSQAGRTLLASDGKIYIVNNDNVLISDTAVNNVVHDTIKDYQVGAWDNNAIALTDSGKIYTWSNLPASTPTEINMNGVLKNKTIIQVSAGPNHALVLTSDGQVYGFGENESGQLGNGAFTHSSDPIAVDTSGVLKNKFITSISAGNCFSLAVDSSGVVYGWGYNGYGELGNNNAAIEGVPTVANLSSKLNNKQVTVFAGFVNNSYLIDGDGNVYSSGLNDEGMLGDGLTDVAPRARFEKVALEGVLYDKKVSDISIGDDYMMALTTDGQVYTWGENNSGVLGNSLVDDYSENHPVPVDMTGVLSGKTITAISAGGSDFALALASDGTVYSWGYNGNGELGNGTMASSPVPVAVDTTGVLKGKTITAISAGADFTLALASDGTVYSWGYNDCGQLGNGTTDSSSVPMPVDMTGALNGKIITAINAGSGYALALASDGTLYGWGYNNDGELGNNSTTSSLAPTAVDIPDGKKIVKISSGYTTGLALASDNTLYSWGLNQAGQLGDGTGLNSLIPVVINGNGASLSGIKIDSIISGQYYSLALDNNGNSYGWGEDYGDVIGWNSPYGYSSVAVPTPFDTTHEVLSDSYSNGDIIVRLGDSNLDDVVISGDGSIITGLTDKSPAEIANLDIGSAKYIIAELTGAYKYEMPTIKSIIPNHGLLKGGDVAEVIGSNLSINDKVIINGLQATNLKLINSEEMIIKTPPSTVVGPSDVVVMDKYGQTAILKKGFIYYNGNNVNQPSPFYSVVLASASNNSKTTSASPAVKNRTSRVRSSKVATVAKLVETKSSLVTRVLSSKFAPYIVPSIFMSVIFFILIVLMYQVYKEYKQAKFLLSITNKNKQTYLAKEDFLRLSSHYLRTPVTLVSSAVDLLTAMPGSGSLNKDIISSLTSISDNLVSKVNNIIELVASSKESLELNKNAKVKVAFIKIILNPVVYLPVVLSIILTIGLNLIINNIIKASTINVVTIINQTIIIALGLIVLYTMVRIAYMRKKRNDLLKGYQARIDKLTNLETNLITLTYHDLTDDVLHLTGINLTELNNKLVEDTISEGKERLENLIARFSVLVNILDKDKITLNSFNLTKTVNMAVDQYNDSSSYTKLILDTTALTNAKTSATISSNNYLITQVLSTTLTSLADTKSRTTNIKLSLARDKSTNKTKLTILGRKLDQPAATSLYSIYSNEQTNEQVQKAADLTKLDLYLDKAIMLALGGNITAKLQGDSSEVTVEM